jgi:hypothetical protein
MMHLKTISRLGTTFAAVALLASGCTFLDATPSLECPAILLDDVTSTVTVFSREGRDLTDQMYAAKITGYRGTCRYDSEGVDISMFPEFEVERGASFDPSAAQLQYYVAVPRYFPRPEGKQVFKMDVGFPANVSRVYLRDSEVVLRLPITPNMNPKDFDVHIGFQLTPEQ